MEHTFFNRRLRPYIKGILTRLNWIPLIEPVVGDPSFLSGMSEYLKGIPEDVYEMLYEICEPEIIRTEKLLGINLDRWRNSKKREDCEIEQ